MNSLTGCHSRRDLAKFCRGLPLVRVGFHVGVATGAAAGGGGCLVRILPAGVACSACFWASACFALSLAAVRIFASRLTVAAGVFVDVFAGAFAVIGDLHAVYLGHRGIGIQRAQ